jgi:tetratricopeptide (TPR) repeat protein
VNTQPKLNAAAALLALLVGLGAGAAALAQEQQQQQQEPPPPSFGAAPGQPGPEEVEALKTIATTSNPDQRLVLVQEFLAKYPESLLKGRVYALAAEAYRMQNKHAQVIEYGEKAIEDSQGRDAFTMLLVADSLAESAQLIHADYKDKLARAEQHAARALEILPELFASMQRRPEVPEEEYVRQQRKAEALGHAILGNVYLRQQQNDKAVEELTKALETEGYQPDAVDFHRLALAHLRQRQYKEAEGAFQKCVDHGGGAAADCQQQLDRVRQRMAEQEKPQP